MVYPAQPRMYIPPDVKDSDIQSKTKNLQQMAGDVVPFPKTPIGIGAMSPEVRKAYEEIIKNATVKTIPMYPPGMSPDRNPK
jgi:hypothetical protein